MASSQTSSWRRCVGAVTTGLLAFAAACSGEKSDTTDSSCAAGKTQTTSSAAGGTASGGAASGGRPAASGSTSTGGSPAAGGTNLAGEASVAGATALVNEAGAAGATALTNEAGAAGATALTNEAGAAGAAAPPPPCASGSYLCLDGKCHDLATDNANCGACSTLGTTDRACPAGNACSAGVCSVSCPGSQVNCSGMCVNPATDPIHCGATSGCGVNSVGSAGAACPAGNVCNTGVCSVSCPGSQVNCSGMCVNPATDPIYCGATSGCGVSSIGSAGSTCAAGKVCVAGTCSIACETGRVACGGACIDPSSNPSYCGATIGCGVSGVGSVGVACAIGAACSAGVCSTVVNPVADGILANYDARIPESVTKDASNRVSIWADVSGNHYDLTVNGTSPVYQQALINSLPGLDYSGGAGMFSDAAGIPISRNSTVFFVIRWRTPDTWGTLGHHGSRDNDWAIELNSIDGTPPNIVHFQTNDDNIQCQMTIEPNVNWILTGRMDTTSGRYFSTYSTSAGLRSVTASGNGITEGNKRLWLGKSDHDEVSNAYYGQVLYYGRALSDAERDQVLAYLRASWRF